MASKSPPLNADQPGAAPSPSTVQDAAQQIWLAGLGAFAKAQEQGSKVFETLVQEGLALQHQTQTAAEAKIAEASRRMRAMSSEIQTQAEDRRDKLETIFEDRVAKALSRLGTPSATHIEALAARLDELEKYVQQMSHSGAAAPPAAAPPRKTRKPG
jgi:poly(hydroxyalkanoate) granule-associated protein